MLEIVTTSRREIGGKKVPLKVFDVPLDSVSFHSVENVQKWNFVCQIRIDLERELRVEDLKCKEIVDLLKVVGLMKTVFELGPCYTKLVK